jgi:hypothetical protein
MCLDNFKTREISRGAHKLTWTPIFLKKMCLDNNIQVLVLLPYISANISSITCSKKKKTHTNYFHEYKFRNFGRNGRQHLFFTVLGEGNTNFATSLLIKTRAHQPIYFTSKHVRLLFNERGREM